MINANTRLHWVRSSNGWLAGICQGLGERFGISPNLLRGLWLVAFFFFGTGLLAYIILAFTLPREDELDMYGGKVFLGVCLRLSEQTGIELPALRSLTVFLALASFGTVFLVYVVLNFFLPETSPKTQPLTYEGDWTIQRPKGPLS